ncbi:hypothetical protein F5882DRAFT_381823 [Hyaloscypha sp. PMI_1271]|nr:hypothetical protein F5882DRAFT_381823 [Hyaloscypha sp. PMI_1271]
MDEYETTIEIINKEKEDLSFKEVLIDPRTRKTNSKVMLSLKRLPTSLVEAVEDRGRGGQGGFNGPRGPEGGCYTCGGQHWKKQCAKWHKSDEAVSPLSLVFIGSAVSGAATEPNRPLNIQGYRGGSKVLAGSSAEEVLKLEIVWDEGSNCYYCARQGESGEMEYDYNYNTARPVGAKERGSRKETGKGKEKRRK